MCKETGHGIEIATTITKMFLSLKGFAFVDNSDLAQAAADQDTIGEEMIDEFEDFMRRWEGGIRTSGGAICPNKTKGFLFNYIWRGNKFIYRSIDEIPGNVSIPDQDGNMMIIKREELLSAYESLGIQLTLTGDRSKQVEVLKEKSEVFAAQIRARKYNKTTALWTLMNSFFPSMIYPMVATHFTKNKWMKIIRPAVRATLSSSGMAKKTFQGAFFLSQKFQGLNVYHPYFHQEIIHIQTIFQGSLRNSQTGRLLRANAEAFRIEIGVPFSLSDMPYNRETFA